MCGLSGEFMSAVVELLQQGNDTVGNAEVLVEGPSRTDARVWTGRTRTNKIVLWDHCGAEAAGDLVSIKITHPQTWVLKGELQQD